MTARCIILGAILVLLLPTVVCNLLQAKVCDCRLQQLQRLICFISTRIPHYFMVIASLLQYDTNNLYIQMQKEAQSKPSSCSGLFLKQIQTVFSYQRILQQVQRGMDKRKHPIKLHKKRYYVDPTRHNSARSDTNPRI